MRSVLVGFLFYFIFFSASACAQNYYVDKNSMGGSCSDYNAGTSLSAPWCTLAKANQILQAGDTVYIRAGTYEENDQNSAIVPRNSGSAGNYITYQSYPGETVIIRGTKARNNPSSLVNLQPGRNYIKLYGLTLTGGSQAETSLDPIVYIASSHDLIQNCIVEYGTSETGGAMAGIHIAKQGANRPAYVQLINNTLRYIGRQVSPTEEGMGECVRVEGSYHIIDGNMISACGHNGIGDYDSDHIIVRNNNMHGDWFRGIGVGALPRAFDDIRYLIENNVIWDVHGYDPWGEYAYASQFSGRSTIFRRNLIYDTDGVGIAVYAEAAFPEVRDSMFYHNVIVNAGRMHYAPSGWAFSFNERDDGSLSNCAIKNNIFYNNYLDGIEYREYAVPSEHDITYNHWNADGDPGFMDLTNRNFYLQPSSPCKDAGGWLTTIASPDGSGTSFVVDNPHYFMDGYGIAGGDVIQLEGQTATASIVSVNYGSNTLTLNRSLTWTNGQGVALAYSGSAPDIGAFEYSDGSTPPPCTSNDWNYSDGSCQPDNTSTRTWTKTGTCTGGVTHPGTETVSCVYVPPASGTNLALNAAVTTSNEAYSQASYMVDGLRDQVGLHWAGMGTPNWVRIDMGSDYSIDSIKINPFGNGGVSNYYYDGGWNIKYANSSSPSVWRDFTSVIKVSGAGTLAASGIAITNGDPGSQASNDSYKYYAFTFDVVNARYVLFNVTAGDRDGDSNGDEIEIYSPGAAIPGDLNNDDSVNIVDLGIVASDFGKTSGFNPKADVIANGKIDIYDMVFVASRFS